MTAPHSADIQKRHCVAFGAPGRAAPPPRRLTSLEKGRIEAQHLAAEKRFATRVALT